MKHDRQIDVRFDEKDQPNGTELQLGPAFDADLPTTWRAAMAPRDLSLAPATSASNTTNSVGFSLGFALSTNCYMSSMSRRTMSASVGRLQRHGTHTLPPPAPRHGHPRGCPPSKFPARMTPGFGDLDCTATERDLGRLVRPHGRPRLPLRGRCRQAPWDFPHRRANCCH